MWVSGHWTRSAWSTLLHTDIRDVMMIQDTILCTATHHCTPSCKETWRETWWCKKPHQAPPCIGHTSPRITTDHHTSAQAATSLVWCLPLVTSQKFRVTQPRELRCVTRFAWHKSFFVCLFLLFQLFKYIYIKIALFTFAQKKNVFQSTPTKLHSGATVTLTTKQLIVFSIRLVSLSHIQLNYNETIKLIFV